MVPAVRRWVRARPPSRIAQVRLRWGDLRITEQGRVPKRGEARWGSVVTAVGPAVTAVGPAVTHLGKTWKGRLGKAQTTDLAPPARSYQFSRSTAVLVM